MIETQDDVRLFKTVSLNGLNNFVIYIVAHNCGNLSLINSNLYFVLQRLIRVDWKSLQVWARFLTFKEKFQPKQFSSTDE